MNIKKVSELTGISVDTIRYYEKIGLIPYITRNKNGIRNFTDNEISILEFVRFFRGAGVPVESLIEYIQLIKEGDSTVYKRLSILKNEKVKLEERIESLNKALERLNYKIQNYEHVLEKEKKIFKK